VCEALPVLLFLHGVCVQMCVSLALFEDVDTADTGKASMCVCVYMYARHSLSLLLSC